MPVWRRLWAVGPYTGIFELEQADPVVMGVDEPGRQREPEVGHPVDGAQLGEVLDGDAPGPQLGDLAGQVVHPPGRLGLLVARAGGALGDDQATVAPAGEGEELLVGLAALQAEGAFVEAAGHAQVGGQQHHIHRIPTKHPEPPWESAGGVIPAGRGTAIGAAAWSPAA